MEDVHRFLRRPEYESLNLFIPGQGHCKAIDDLEKLRDSAIKFGYVETFALLGAKIKLIREDLRNELDKVEEYRKEGMNYGIFENDQTSV